MAKKPKVPLNVLVTEETRDAIRFLSETLECAQGVVVDKAIRSFSTCGEDVPEGEFLASAYDDARRTQRSINHVISGRASPVVLPPAEPFEERIVDNRPKNAYCKHCGERFAGQRFATLCPNCKSTGHTNQPNECPRCNEGMGI